MSELLISLRQRSDLDRLDYLEARAMDKLDAGDFEGNVTGQWVRFNENAAGIVRYNNKDYVTQPIGFTSVPAGTRVQLSYARGTYFSSF